MQRGGQGLCVRIARFGLHFYCFNRVFVAEGGGGGGRDLWWMDSGGWGDFFLNGAIRKRCQLGTARGAQVKGGTISIPKRIVD